MSLSMVKMHLTSAFARLGTQKDAKSAMPQSEDNRAAIAWEYFVADLLCSIATKRKEAAKKAAEEAGVIIKPEVGETQTVYQNETLQIIGATKNPSETLDRTVLNSELIKVVGAEAAQTIVGRATKKSSPATVYSFVSAGEG